MDMVLLIKCIIITKIAFVSGLLPTPHQINFGSVEGNCGISFVPSLRSTVHGLTILRQQFWAWKTINDI